MDARTGTESELVPRFSSTERTLHWLLASTFLTMLATGLILELPALAELAADRRLWKSIHLGAAIGFWAGLVVLLMTARSELAPAADRARPLRRRRPGVGALGGHPARR